jgi:alanine racemase
MSTPSSAELSARSCVAAAKTIRVDAAALRANMRQFRELVSASARLLAVVKADGYGHGLVTAARAFLAGGAEVLGVHGADEVTALRRAGIDANVLVLGPLGQDEIVEAAAGAAEITVASLPACSAVRAAAAAGAAPRVHLKIETGVNRQGLTHEEIPAALELLERTPGVVVAGVSSHFADIEDTTDHAFARRQQERFEQAVAELAARGHAQLCRHMSCSASAILWESSHRDLVRIGIAAYGLWPSRETLVSARAAGRATLDLRPALTWAAPIAQIKPVSAGASVGYGRTWKALTASRIAVLPVGYADGYCRRLSNGAHVLVRGHRAPVRGRICMNLMMIDVTHIPDAIAGDEAVLLGRQGEEEVSAAELAELAGTIAYEVVTWPHGSWRRETFDGATTFEEH